MKTMKTERACDFCGNKENVEFNGKEIKFINGQELEIAGRNSWGDVIRRCKGGCQKPAGGK